MTAPTSTAHAPASLALGLLRAARPKQWVKNLLLLAAPALGGALSDGNVLGDAVLGIVCFILASSGTYLINDARDVVADRLHPTKRNRPIAAGTVTVRLAWTVGFVLMAMSLLLAGLVLPTSFLLVLVAYLVLTMAYQLGLKEVAVWELAIVAAGFVLRLIAGGTATGVPLSSWFLIVGGGASFFVVVTKRKAEINELGEDAVAHRAALGAYSRDILLMGQAAALAVTTTAYSLWAFADGPHPEPSAWLEISVVPLFLGMLRFAQQAETTEVSAPEELLLRDRQIIGLGLLWVVLVIIGISVSG